MDPKTKIPLHMNWPSRVKSANLHVIALAQYETAYARAWAANSLNARMRLKARAERLEQEVTRLREEIHIAHRRR